jgi:chaperonin cofactor prefoldin
MEHLQQQIWELSQQVRSLTQVVESMPQQVTSTLIEQTGLEASTKLGFAAIEHKDVLVEKTHSSWSNHVNDHEISSEWQVRRLTAQLTSAYNRIAALEEELLSRRVMRS